MMLLPELRPFNIGPPSSSRIPTLAVPGGIATPISRADQSGQRSTRDGVYSNSQAERGQAVYTEHCAACHGMDLPGDPFAPSLTGAAFFARWNGRPLGDQHLLLNLGGRYAHKYPSVYYLFRRVRDSMPSSDADSVSVAAKVDIVAYILQQNGFPADRTPLPLDVVAMKEMRLNGGNPEAGFERVFNGKDFTGIDFLIGPNCRPAPQGCHRTEPGTTFTAQDGAIVTDGTVQGYWYTEKQYFNFTLRFDVRHVPLPDWDPGDDYFDGNSGYLIFVTEHRVWQKGIEIQGNHMTMLAPIGMDAMAKYTDDDEAPMRARRPAGEWHSVEIVAGGGQVTSYLNNALVTRVAEHEFKEAGHIGFQSEGAELHWRNIRIRAE